MSRISAPMPRIERTDEPGEPDCSVSMSPAGDSYVASTIDPQTSTLVQSYDRRPRASA